MKRAVSISIGSSRRNKAIETKIFDQPVLLERIGTDGDLEKAARLYQELDGKVDAFGVGGAVQGLMVKERWYVMHSVQKMIRFVKKTPIVDGTGLKMTLESKVAETIEKELGGYIQNNHPASLPKRSFVAMALDRWGTAQSFLNANYECIFGDLMFGLGIGLPVKSENQLILLAKILLPVVSRLPFRWVYPIGKAQEMNTPKWEKYFQWASVIAGDCHYLTRYMPNRLSGKVIVTNTTTAEDRSIFQRANVKYLITTTPILDGRSFGTNMMEAGILAAIGRKEAVDYAKPGNYFQEMQTYIDRLGFTPQVQEL